MNNIGSAATQTTAATNNTNSVQTLANLNNLASNFTSSTSSTSGLNFNNLILSLLMQIIQTLLKNMQNKSCCCDQPSRPPILSLSNAEKTKLADALSTDGKTVTIVSVEDSDKSGQLSVGDKVNIQRPTGQLDAQGKPIFESASISLTQAQLDQYQRPNTDIKLDLYQDTNLYFSLVAKDNHIARDKLIITDTDKNGQLSSGDKLSAPRLENSSQNNSSLWEHLLTEDEANAISGRYGKEALGPYLSPDLTVSDLPTHPFSSSNEALAKALNLDTANGDSLRVVFDRDGSRSLTAGDIALVDQPRFATNNSTLPRFATGPYIELDADVVQKTLRSNESLSLSSQDKQRFVSIFTTGSDPANFLEIIDTDKSGAISVGDQVKVRGDVGLLDANNQPILVALTETLTVNNIKTYSNLNAPNQLSVEDTKRAQQSIYPKDTSTGGSNFLKLTGSYYNNDNNNQLSLGDQLEALYYQNTSGSPSSDHPYDVTQLLVDEDFFKRYKELQV